MDISAALPTFVIVLREGVEAALVVGIVLACLKKAQRSHLNPWAYAGIAAGLGGSGLVGVVLSGLFDRVHLLEGDVEAVVEPLLKLGLCAVAIAMLSWMLIWMTRQAKSLKGEIEQAVLQGLDGTPGAEGPGAGTNAAGTNAADTNAAGAKAGWGVFGLVLIAVLREGFEAVVFILANWQRGLDASLGAIAGLFGAVAIGVALFRFGIRIDLRRFFLVMGLLLLLIVAGLTTSLLKSADGAVVAIAQLNHTQLCISQASCILGPLVWNFSGWLPQDVLPGLLLKSLLGYRDHLYLAQAVLYVGFLGTVGTLYFRSLVVPNAAAASLKSGASGRPA